MAVKDNKDKKSKKDQSKKQSKKTQVIEESAKENKIAREAKVKKEVSVNEEADISNDFVNPISNIINTAKNFTPNKKVFIPLIIVLLAGGLLLWTSKNKSAFVVAKVAGVYVTRSELNRHMYEEYGTKALDDLITIKLIEIELNKEKVSVSDAEINSKISEIESTLGGAKIDDVLSAQGLTLDKLKARIKLQLGMEKYLSSRVTVTDDEVNKFFDQYKEQLSGDSDEAKKEDAKKSLFNQKLQQAIGDWVEEIKANREIIKYL